MAITLMQYPVKIMGDEQHVYMYHMCREFCILVKDRNKHIYICYHFIHDRVENTVIVEFTRTGEQKADILTKSLGGVLFKELRDKVVLMDVKYLRQG